MPLNPLSISAMVAAGLTPTQIELVRSKWNFCAQPPANKPAKVWDKNELKFRSTVSNDISRAANVKDGKFQEHMGRLREFGQTHPSVKPRDTKTRVYIPMEHLKPTTPQAAREANRAKWCERRERLRNIQETDRETMWGRWR